MHKSVSKYNHEISIVSALFHSVRFCVKLFFDKLMQLLDYLSLI